jgi:Alpha/beta hydrolase domain
MLTRLVIQRREPFAGGHEFPITGAYEKLVGKLYGEVDPANRLNRIIVNLAKAPRNRRGRVEYSGDFCILKPLDMERGNDKIFFDAPNRGGKRIVAFLNDAPQSNDPVTLQDAGNGFLMRQGYTIVWCGWQGDLMPAKNWLTLKVPIATHNGSDIVRRTRTEIVVDEKGVKSQPLSGDERVQSYAAASFDKSKASLTVREKSYGARILVPTDEWEFAACVKQPHSGKESVRPSATDLYLRDGFKPGHIYEFIYPAKNPLVLGLGFAAVRDFVSFLRYAIKDSAGRANPLLTDQKTALIRYAYGWGRSQSGRFLRDLVYHGFNEDEAHRKVFDAIAPHVAGGGRMFLNYEFSRPVTSSQQHTNQLDPELFPHAYNSLKDAQTGRRDGVLKRPKTDPVIFHTQTSTEYWQKRGCLAHTDGRGGDLKLPENVRLYVIASAQHNSPFGSEAVKEDTQQRINPLPAGDVLRALMVAMDLWVSQGIPPPPSRHPMVRDGTLVAPQRVRFPRIPGVPFAGLHNRQLFLDYGPKIGQGRIDNHPPKHIGNGSYTILVPQVDKNGNDVAGVRLPSVQVPIGTYTGWNLRPADLAEDELSGLLGSFIPFARTAAERKSTGDPRLSIEARYDDQNDYVRQVSRAARALVTERFLLPEDAERIITEAAKAKIFAKK